MERQNDVVLNSLHSLNTPPQHDMEYSPSDMPPPRFGSPPPPIPSSPRMDDMPPPSYSTNLRHDEPDVVSYNVPPIQTQAPQSTINLHKADEPFSSSRPLPHDDASMKAPLI